MKRLSIKQALVLIFLLVLCGVSLQIYLTQEASTVHIIEREEKTTIPSALKTVALVNDLASKVANGKGAQKPKVRTGPAQYYCNFPTNDEVNEIAEGTPPEDDNKGKWTLKQVQVVIRHGDRAPLDLTLYRKQDFMPEFCNVFSDTISNEMLKSFRSSISKDYQDSKTSKFVGPVPNSPFCAKGQLSVFGVNQQLHSGYMLRSKYAAQLKLVENVRDAVNAYTTHVTRTLQSAVAFLYGLLPDYHLDQVPITVTANILFCGNRCFCPAADNELQAYKKVQYRVYANRQRHNSTVRKIDSTFGVGDHATSQIDHLVTGYLCKNLSLPCNASDHCVTMDDLDKLMDEQEHQNKATYTSPPGRRYSLLVAQPMLQKILEKMKLAVTQAETANKFVLYSGHDTTLRPLVIALGIPEYRWPRLATRLVFELWEKDDSHYVRLIFNGKDLTGATSFCGKGLQNQSCSFQSLQQFVYDGIAEELGYSTRDEACAKKVI